MKKLNGISDIRRFFYRNQTPTYFISATNFNLLGMDEWVRNFKYINYIDCFDKHHPNVITLPEKTDRVFNSIEEINNYLLEHKEIVDYINERGPGGRAVFLFFDERTEELCKELGLELCFPPASLREQVDNKISATRIGDEAGVKSVPNVLGKVESYEGMLKLAEAAGIGTDLVIQTAFGDSGHTTFFIASEEDYKKYAEEIGLDMAAFRKALDEGTYKDVVDAEMSLGSEVFVDGTPTMFVNGVRVGNATDVAAISAEIDKALGS